MSCTDKSSRDRATDCLKKEEEARDRGLDLEQGIMDTDLDPAAAMSAIPDLGNARKKLSDGGGMQHSLKETKNKDKDDDVDEEEVTAALQQLPNFEPHVEVEGMNVEQSGDAEARFSLAEVKPEEAQQIQKEELGIEGHDCNKADAAAARQEAPQSPKDESFILKRPRRSSDASRSGLRKLNTAKSRYSSLNAAQRLGKQLPEHAAPQLKGNPRPPRRRGGEDGDELRQPASSSEELNVDADGDEVMGYRCGICFEEFEGAKSLSQHKKHHGNYTLRTNRQKSTRLIDQEYTRAAAAPAGAAAAVLPAIKRTSSVSEEFPKPCTECGKEFSSWKALFGHMRCHPEREWRGIQRPPERSGGGGQGAGPSGAGNPPRRRKRPAGGPPLPRPAAAAPPQEEDEGDWRATEAEPESDSDSIEAAYMSGGRKADYVMGWMTKRSRHTPHSAARRQQSSGGGAGAAAAVAAGEFGQVQMEMIEALVLLHGANKLIERQALSSTLDESDCSKGRATTSESPASTAAAGWASTEEDAAEPEPGEDEEDPRGAQQKMEIDHASLCGDTEDGSDEFDAGEQGNTSRTKYECATCKRQFKSHQALGGHRASHKKVKGCFARTNVNEEELLDEADGDDDADDGEFLKSDEQLPSDDAGPHNPSRDEPEERPSGYLAAARDDNEEMLSSAARKARAHECTICHRVFSTGQALGGHKRCHWGGVPAEAKPPTGGGQQSRPPAEGILDLNLPAPECLEELAAQAGGGYAPLDYTFLTLATSTSRSLFAGAAETRAAADGADPRADPVMTQFTAFERAFARPGPHVGIMAAATTH